MNRKSASVTFRRFSFGFMFYTDCSEVFACIPLDKICGIPGRMGGEKG